MQGIGLEVPSSAVAAPPKGMRLGGEAIQGLRSLAVAMEQARLVIDRHRAAGGDPARLHPRGARAPASPRPPEEFERMASFGLEASPITEILIEQSIAGWKEYELEVMRDNADNCVIICSIENVDPDGRAHRRLHHRGTGPDPVRRRVPADA